MFCLIFNSYEILLSNLIDPGFLIFTDVATEIGMFSVSNFVVETIATSKMVLYYSW